MLLLKGRRDGRGGEGGGSLYKREKLSHLWEAKAYPVTIATQNGFREKVRKSPPLVATPQCGARGAARWAANAFYTCARLVSGVRGRRKLGGEAKLNDNDKLLLKKTTGKMTKISRSGPRSKPRSNRCALRSIWLSAMFVMH